MNYVGSQLYRLGTDTCFCQGGGDESVVAEEQAGKQGAVDPAVRARGEDRSVGSEGRDNWRQG